MRKGIVIGGMVLGLLMGCNNGIAELEKENSFYKSVVKIGQGFQEIFGNFGNAIGEALGFNAVKSSDNKSKVGEHFDEVKKGLEGTKNKLKKLSGEISSTKNVDGNTTKVIEEAIQGANGVFDKLIDALTKLAEVAKGASGTIGDNHTNAVGADQKDVNTIIENVKAIVDIAKESKVDIKPGTPGSNVAAGQGNAPAALVRSGGNANAGAGAKLADEVAQADPWAMIDKIKGAKTDATLNGDTNNEVRALATKAASGDNQGAKTKADLAAAVALRAMTNTGKFNTSSTDVDAVKAAAANAINKVLGVLDEIIRRTVLSELSKVGKAVNGMQYSENTAEKSEGDTK